MPSPPPAKMTQTKAHLSRCDPNVERVLLSQLAIVMLGPVMTPPTLCVGATLGKKGGLSSRRVEVVDSGVSAREMECICNVCLHGLDCPLPRQSCQDTSLRRRCYTVVGLFLACICVLMYLSTLFQQRGLDKGYVRFHSSATL